MQLPVDVNALMNEVTDVQAAREMSLAVSVYIDETAPDDLAAHVRNAFASSSSLVRMTVTYIGESFTPHPTDDIAIVVAGETGIAGEQAAAVRGVGVPTMVVTLEPGRIDRISKGVNCPVPDGDIISPWGEEETGGEFDEKAADALNDRMGRWIVAVCTAKRLAFAIAFPFMRRPLAKDAVQVSALENAGIGLLSFIPGADLPIMTLVQAKMVLQIAAAYGQEMSVDRLKEVGAVVIGAYLSRSIARKLIAAVPVIGFVVRTGIAYGSTYAMGNAVIEYFEGGQNATGVANVLERATGVGTKTVSSLQEKATVVAPLVSKFTAKQE